MTASMMFDYMGILLDKQALADYDFLFTNDQENIEKIIKTDGDEKLVTLLAENMNQVAVSATATFNIVEP
ncbi:MAG: hypothetical protein ACI4Q5_05525 [Porcipelethomonas sp.]